MESQEQFLSSQKKKKKKKTTMFNVFREKMQIILEMMQHCQPLVLTHRDGSTLFLA